VFSTKNPLRVLVHIIEPWGEYDADNAGTTDADNNLILGYTGFLPTLWLTLTASQGLNCEYFDGDELSQDEVISALEAGDYDVALGAFTITAARTEQVQFLHQFYGGGIRIMTIDPNIVNPNSWFFLIPFTTRLWIIWLGAIVIVAHLIYLMEWDTPTFQRADENSGRLKRMTYYESILDALVMSTSVLFFSHEPPRGKHSRWFIAIWEWIVLVLISAYTANMTSFITNSSAAEAVIDSESSLYLETTNVITVPNTASANILEAANISYTACDTPDMCLEWMYEAISTNSTLNLTDDDKYNAFVYDDVNIEYWARTSTECSFITAGNPFNSFSAAIPVRYNYIPDDIISNLNLLLIELWSGGNMTQWIASYIKSGYPCDAYTGAVSETTPLTVDSFWYLWILIGGGSLIFCTVVICTVERSHTPIEEQMAELEYLMKENGGQIARVATLSETADGGGGAFMTGEDDKKQKQKKKKAVKNAPVDLYSGGDDGGGEAGTGKTTRSRTNEDVKQLQKAISDSKTNKSKIEEEEPLHDGINAVEQEPKQMVKEKTQEKLNALSVFAMDFDPLKGTENNAPRQKSSKEKEEEKVAEQEEAVQPVQDDDGDEEEWSKSYDIKFEPDEPAHEDVPAEMVRELSDDDIANAFTVEDHGGDKEEEENTQDADADADASIMDQLPTAPNQLSNKLASTAL